MKHFQIKLIDLIDSTSVVLSIQVTDSTYTINPRPVQCMREKLVEHLVESGNWDTCFNTGCQGVSFGISNQAGNVESHEGLSGRSFRREKKGSQRYKYYNWK